MSCDPFAVSVKVMLPRAPLYAPVPPTTATVLDVLAGLVTPSTMICPSRNSKTALPLNQTFPKLLPLTTVNWLYEVPMRLPVLPFRIGLRVYNSYPTDSRKRLDLGF